ncbi:MAG: hypothetical protein A3D31_15120 [Candidatus Fluviicola riflensis]|nr:MAG: hypothetical protein CHH17_00055 [Candidatus Fluviicola riflensis]OGS78294.1 MAG: hypothetical protein A3D31_15120 [Candidatus Fluviicola riflensis]OGS85360.1 MAG: hypothetical protein A2724_12055 [Fluviicola sp. RIFCSPHIGHO2_01_FULL_43_53]OGS87402.1 MAG: hypothetical protein A3E30_08475 [Fluviicola sp. RIFCSPHIGHO2_12_FULL_43_24]
MRGTLIICALLLHFTTDAKTLKLDFEPQGRTIKICFDSLTIYTDTTALFSVYEKFGTIKDYNSRLMTFVRSQLKKSDNDTLTFSGKFIPFNDGIQTKTQEDWYVEWAILHLIKTKKLKMYDKHGRQVKAIRSKRVGKKKNHFVKRSFMNKATGEELFKEILFARIIATPDF